jgi:hypothetical protein
MNEERLSTSLYEAALKDPAAQVLSWQGVDGKGYFAADVKLRLPDRRRIEPDLVIWANPRLWLIEIKARHSESLADERKLVELLELLDREEILRQVKARSRFSNPKAQPLPAVAFFEDDLAGRIESCVGCIVHIPWDEVEARAKSGSLGEALTVLYREQMST